MQFALLRCSLNVIWIHIAQGCFTADIIVVKTRKWQQSISEIVYMKMPPPIWTNYEDAITIALFDVFWNNHVYIIICNNKHEIMGWDILFNYVMDGWYNKWIPIRHSFNILWNQNNRGPSQ